MKKKYLVVASLLFTAVALSACSNTDTKDTTSSEPKTEEKVSDKAIKYSKKMTKYLDAIKDQDLQMDNLGEAKFKIENSGVTPKEAVGFVGESDTKMAIYILNSGEDTTKLSDYFLDNNYKTYYDDMYKYVLVSEYELPNSWFKEYENAVATS